MKIFSYAGLIAITIWNSALSYNAEFAWQQTLIQQNAQLTVQLTELATAENKLEELRREAYVQGREDEQEVRQETERMAQAKCDPTKPPYLPCCGEDALPGGITEESWPKPDEFRNGRFLTLSCAHTANYKPEQGALWVCGRTEAHCLNSKQRVGDCSTCYVYLANGAASAEDYAWTSHALDEMDGPWTADGKRGAFP